MMCGINRLLRRFRRDEDGAVVVDFIPVFFGLIIVVLVIFEIGIAYFLSLRSYKAAQVGARFATVIEAVHSDVPSINERRNEIGRLGVPCYNPIGVNRCDDPGGPWICDGGNFSSDCDADLFNLVLNDMRRTMPDLEPNELTISYFYEPTLGVTGGPFIPEVNVRIDPQAYRFVVFRLGRSEKGTSPEQLVRNPGTRYGGVSASAFGENIGSL